jgi:hypothetical protein
MPRTAALVLGLALAACSRGEDAGNGGAGKQAAGDPIRCAIGGAQAFASDCTREVDSGPDGEVWVISHPDGSFRRFVLIDGGTRIATADGADEVQAERVGADLEVRVAGNRYLFPAAPEPKASPAHAQ